MIWNKECMWPETGIFDFGTNRRRMSCWFVFILILGSSEVIKTLKWPILWNSFYGPLKGDLRVLMTSDDPGINMKINQHNILRRLVPKPKIPVSGHIHSRFQIILDTWQLKFFCLRPEPGRHSSFPGNIKKICTLSLEIQANPVLADLRPFLAFFRHFQLTEKKL